MDTMTTDDDSFAMAKSEGNNLRSRHSFASLPSLSDSSLSDVDDQPSSTPGTTNFANNSMLNDCCANDDPTKVSTTSKQHDDIVNICNNATTQRTLHRTLSSIASPQTRLSRQSSLTWGHKPSPFIGASCLLFLLPIPLLLQSCYSLSAFLLGCVAVSSYLSDHVYTGLESWAHTFDRVMAPLAFASCLHSGVSTGGMLWVICSFGAVGCHVMAHNCAKKGLYDEFVFWHSMWHVVGVGLVLGCFFMYGNDGSCWEGSHWESWFHHKQ